MCFMDSSPVVAIAGQVSTPLIGNDAFQEVDTLGMTMPITKHNFQAMGIIHGPLDLEMIRDIDDGKKTANECFSRAGAVKVAGVDTKVARAKDEIIRMYLEGSREAELAIQTMVMPYLLKNFVIVFHLGC